MHLSQIDTSVELPIMEQFYTIQGEGFHSGRAAYFIRIAGCDVGCVWCDVKESWDLAVHPLAQISDIVKTVKENKADFVVITGGEPAMYDLTTLVNALKVNDIKIAIETSGCYELIGKVDWYCFSPKKFKAPTEEAYTKASELKVVISHPSDISWAEAHAEKVNTDCMLFLQPEWNKQEKILPLIIEYVKGNQRWRISLQTHKFMQIP